MAGPLSRTRSDDTRPLARLPAALQATFFSLATAAVLLFQVGYGFEVGDQLQYLLLPYRDIYPDFLPGDWFTWQTSHYHETFAWIVRALAGALGTERLPAGIFGLYVANLALFGYGMLRLALALGFGLFEASCAVIGFAMVRQMGLAGAVLSHGMLVPADLALPSFLLACAAYARGAPLALGAYLGLAGFMHANYAVLGPLALFPLAWLDRRERGGVWPLLRAASLYLLIAAPTLRVVLGSFLIRDAAPEAVAVTLFTRSPHHYDLGAMRPDEFYYAFSLGLLALPRMLGQAGTLRTRGTYLRLTAALLSLILLGALGSGLHVLALSRLFTWRMSIPLFALWWLGAGAALRAYCRQRRLAQLVWAAALCVVLTSFAQTDPLEHSPWNALPRAAALGGCMLALASGLVLWRWRGQRRLGWALRALGALVSLGGAALALSVTHSTYWQGAAFKPARGLHFLDGHIAIEARDRPLYRAIRQRTPHAARFLIPPGQSQFRMHARRAVYVDWKCAPMRGDEALEWQRRMLATMGLPSFPARGYSLPRAADRAYFARPLPELAALARRENLTHLLTFRRRGEAPPGLELVLESGRYAVYAVLR